MNRLFSLVKGMLRTAPESARIAGRLLKDAVDIERYMIAAGLAGISGLAARQYLADEVEDRLARGLCGHIACAAPRAQLRWRLADVSEPVGLPAQRGFPDMLQQGLRPQTPEEQRAIEEQAQRGAQLIRDLSAEVGRPLMCLVCWTPMNGPDCLNCQANGWPKLPSFDTEPLLPPASELWPMEGPEPVTQCLGCGNPMVPGMNCATCTAAVSDVWAFQQLGTGLLDDLPHLCHHGNEVRGVMLPDSAVWARCQECGAYATSEWPQVPELQPMWVWPDGSVTEDV